MTSTDLSTYRAPLILLIIRRDALEIVDSAIALCSLCLLWIAVSLLIKGFGG